MIEIFLLILSVLAEKSKKDKASAFGGKSNGATATDQQSEYLGESFRDSVQVS